MEVWILQKLKWQLDVSTTFAPFNIRNSAGLLIAGGRKLTKNYTAESLFHESFGFASKMKCSPNSYSIGSYHCQGPTPDFTSLGVTARKMDLMPNVTKASVWDLSHCQFPPYLVLPNLHLALGLKCNTIHHFIKSSPFSILQISELR